MRSLLGPNPRFGARLYGIGNELEAMLPVLALVGVAALAPRRPALAFGAVMPPSARRRRRPAGRRRRRGHHDRRGGTGAVLCCRPGRPSRRAIVLAAAVPVAALGLLAAIDIVTGGDSHFTRTMLDADSLGDVARTIVQRYELAWDALLRGLMPLATIAAVAAVVWAVRRRRALYAPVAHLPAWRAALAGSLAARWPARSATTPGRSCSSSASSSCGVTAYVRTGATRTE